jgi:hypothetical protein
VASLGGIVLAAFAKRIQTRRCHMTCMGLCSIGSGSGGLFVAASDTMISGITNKLAHQRRNTLGLVTREYDCTCAGSLPP